MRDITQLGTELMARNDRHNHSMFHLFSMASELKSIFCTCANGSSRCNDVHGLFSSASHDIYDQLDLSLPKSRQMNGSTSGGL